MTDEMMQANQVPLVEQLRSVPANAHLAINTPNPLGYDTQHFAIGAMCHKAAARLDALRAELEAAKRDAESMRDALERIVRTPAMPFPDPEAHSWDAYHRAVHRAWAVCHSIALAAIARAAGGEG